MTRRVLRYPIEVDDYTELRLPHRINKFCHVAPSRIDPNGLIDVWYETSDNAPGWVDIRLHVEGTGHPIDHNGTHIGTVVTPNGLVWHVFVEGVASHLGQCDYEAMYKGDPFGSNPYL